MDQVTAYGLAVNLGPAVAPAPVAAVPSAALPASTGFPFEAAWRIDRWESSAVGALLLVGLALYANALLDAS